MRDLILNALQASLESEVVETDPTITSDLDNALRAQDQDRTAVDTAVDAANVADAALESLQAIALSLESAMQTGGLTPQSARFFNLAMQSTCAPLGQDATTASLESFGGTMTRVEATQVSLEGVREFAKKIWEAILGACDRVWNFVLSFLNRLFATNKAVSARIASLERQFHVIDKSKTPKSVKLDLGGLAKKLSVDGKLNVMKAADFTTCCEQIDESVKSAEVAGQEIIDALGGYLRDTASGDLRAITKKYGESLVAAIPHASRPMFVWGGPKDVDVWAGQPMPGDRYLVVLIPKAKISDNADEAILARQSITFLRGVEYKLYEAFSKVKPDPIVDLPTVGEALELAAAMRRSLDRHDAEVANRIKALSTKIKADLKTLSAVETKAPEEVLRVFGRLGTHLGQPIVQIQHYRLDLINEYSRYLQKVLGHYRAA